MCRVFEHFIRAVTFLEGLAVLPLVTMAVLAVFVQLLLTLKVRACNIST